MTHPIPLCLHVVQIVTNLLLSPATGRSDRLISHLSCIRGSGRPKSQIISIASSKVTIDERKQLQQSHIAPDDFWIDDLGFSFCLILDNLKWLDPLPATTHSLPLQLNGISFMLYFGWSAYPNIQTTTIHRMTLNSLYIIH